MPDPMTTPTNLAAVRALAEEAEQSATACSLDVKSPESFRLTIALATALRTLCDENERMREALGDIAEYSSYPIDESDAFHEALSRVRKALEPPHA